MMNPDNNTVTEKRRLGTQIARNSLFGAIQSLISISVLFFVLPYILDTLGVERYAVWALVALITSYGKLSEFGLTKALVYFIPKARLEGGIAKINILISTAISFYAVAVSIMIAILLILRNLLIVYVFEVPDYLFEETMFVLTGAILILGISILSGVFNSVLFGYQRVDIASVILLGYSVIDPLGFYIALKMGYGLPGLIVSRLITTVLMFVAVWFTAIKIAPGLKYNPRLSSRHEFKSIFGYGINTQIESISSILYTSTTKLLLPQLAGLSFVTYYDLALRTRMKARTFFVGALRSITPAASELYANDDMHKLRSLYFRSLRYVFLFALPVFLLMAILAQSFVRIWLGEGFELVATTIMLLSIPGFIILLRNSAAQILKGIGQVRPIAILTAGSVIVNLILSLILGIMYGYFGVVMGMVCVSLVSSFIVIHICNVHIGVTFNEIPKQLSLGAMLLAIFLAIMAFAAINFTLNMGDLFNLLFVVMGYVICYIAGIFGFRFLDSMDLSIIYKLMPNWVPIKWFSGFNKT